MKTIVVTNQKGGVGKSAISVHLAWYLAEQGHRVLLVDTDGQANSTETMLHGSEQVLDAFDLFGTEQLPEVRGEPGQVKLAAGALKLNDLERGDPSIVVRALDYHLNAMGDAFDYCVVDTPPALGLRMAAALYAATFVLSPIELETYSLSGLSDLLRSIQGMKQNNQRPLRFLGMLPNRFTPQSVAQRQALEGLLQNFGDIIIRARIGNRTAIAEALRAGVPVWAIKKQSARDAAAEMREAFEQIVERMGK